MDTDRTPETILEEAAAYLRRRTASKPKISSAKDAADLIMLRPEIVAADKERMFALLLDQKHRLIALEEISVGTLTAALVHPREVFRPAIVNGAAAVIVCHNHPSGEAIPSAEDNNLTARLKSAADILGIPLLDHVIVGAGAFYSFAEAGRI